MGYRDASPPEPKTVPYGTFPTAKSEILFFVIIGLFGLGALVGATHRKVFRCERPNGQVRCVEESSLLWRQTLTRSFEGDQLSSVEFQPYSGHKGKEMGRTDLFDATGQPTAVLRAGRADASGYYHQLRSFLDRPARAELVIPEQNGLWPGLIVGFVLLLWATFIGRSFVRTSGRLEVVVDAAKDAIVVRAHRFGLFQRETVHPLAGLAGIAVEHTHIKRTKTGRGQPGDPAGQLRLDYCDGLPRMLTSTPLPGSDVHEDLAERLRQLTDLEPETRPVVVGGDAPSPSAAKKPRKGWALYLVFLVPVCALGLGVGLEALMGAAGGRVHFRSEQRCKFQGGELLPGGEMSMSLSPGTYTVEIFDPEVDGGWRSDSFTVREGENQTYVCR